MLRSDWPGGADGLYLHAGREQREDSGHHQSAGGNLQSRRREFIHLQKKKHHIHTVQHL